MSTNILDAFLITFGLDAREFKSGEREVRDGSKRLREESKKTFSSMDDGSKQLGRSIKSVSNEIISLGLAVMGARSISGLIGDMVTGAADADRLGATMGMATEKVMAWRQAMRVTGGQNSDADAALQSIQRLRMSFQLGQMDPGQAGVLSRLGIGGSDLRNSNPGDILRKLSAAQSRMDPQLFASLLQQIGLNGPVAYFLMRGQGSVDQLLKQYELNHEDAQKEADQAKQLQKSLAELNAEITKGLVPKLTELVTAVNRAVDILNQIVNGTQPKQQDNFAVRVGKDLWNDFRGNPGTRNFWDELGDAIGGPAGRTIRDNMGRGDDLAGGKKTRAERNNNPGNIIDSDFARRQPGYIGHDTLSNGHVMARFDTAQHGFEAMVKLLLGRTYRGQGRDSIWSIINKYAPASGGNNVVAYAKHIEQLTGIARNAHLTQAQTVMVARAMVKHEGYRGNININTVNVSTQDAKSFPRDLHAKTRRHTVAKADQGMAH